MVSTPSPAGEGLSLLAEQAEKEAIVPGCGFDFAAHGYLLWVRSKHVECEPSQDGEVLGCVVLSCAVGILGKDDVENPVHLVLDGPVGPDDGQEPVGCKVFGQKIVSHEGLVCGTPFALAPGCDSGNSGDGWKVVTSASLL